MTNGQRIIAVASAAEAATGLGLVVLPSLIVGLLLGVEPEGIATVLSRVAGIALVSLAIVCWPERNTAESASTYLAMLVYNAPVGVLLVKLGFDGTSGILLWPAALFHLSVAALLVWAWSRIKRLNAAG